MPLRAFLTGKISAKVTNDSGLRAHKRFTEADADRRPGRGTARSPPVLQSFWSKEPTRKPGFVFHSHNVDNGIETVKGLLLSHI